MDTWDRYTLDELCRAGCDSFEVMQEQSGTVDDDFCLSQVPVGSLDGVELLQMGFSSDAGTDCKAAPSYPGAGQVVGDNKFSSDDVTSTQETNADVGLQLKTSNSTKI